jgi:hypothetical protein
MHEVEVIKCDVTRVKYGTLVEIDHKQFIDFVDNTPASVFTVIHLYKDVSCFINIELITFQLE